MGYNRSLLVAAMLVLVISAATLGGEATRVLTQTPKTGSLSLYHNHFRVSLY